jgi:uncharacterized protein (TIGR02300 family)
LTAPTPCGKAPPDPTSPVATGCIFSSIFLEAHLMVKAEWGTKRSCPKCGTRFYDLGKEDPVVCISCGVAWDPEPVLKSKQPMPFDVPKKEVEKEETDDTDLAAEELDIEDVEENPDDEVDIGGDDDIGVPGAGDEDEEI